jgi:diacylglycerol kinase (ATP)
MKRIIKAFFYSLDGLKATWADEPAFRQEIYLSLFLIPLTLCLPLSSLFKGYLLSSLILIFLMEIVNSAIENIVDLITKDFHDLAKKAKDMGSSIVLVSFLNLMIAWCFALIEML